MEKEWQEGLLALKNYTEETGHSSPPFIYRTDSDYPLGEWVKVQRAAKHKKTLSVEHTTLLESLKGWLWDALEPKWQEGFDALKIYTEETGHANPPRGYKTTTTYRLGEWVKAQKKAKRKNTLSADRIKKLEALPGWAWEANT